MQHKECKVCGIMKTAIRIKRRHGRSYIYLDDYGRQWQGRICPDCHNELGRAAYREKAGYSLSEVIVRDRNEKGMFI